MARTLILCVIALSMSGCMSPSLSRFEKSIVYQPLPPDKPELKERSRYVNIPGCVQEVEIRIPGETAARTEIAGWTHLHGWYAEAKNPKAVVLYCHGNGGNVSHCAKSLIAFCEKLNVTILAFDYRGYGASSPSAPSESDLYFDARQARAWLAARTGVAEKEIVLCGYSLGGGVAVELAAKDGARGLILERTFTSIPAVASHMIPILPVRWLMESRYDSLGKIKDFHGPLLMTHGDRDRVVPFKLGRKLFEAANEPKMFIPVPGGDHCDPPATEYLAALDRFFDELDGPR